VYVSSDNAYTLLIDVDTTQSSNDKLITKFTLDSYESVIDQQNKTITFPIPERQIVNGRVVGTITELEAGSDTIIFFVGGAEYPLRQGAQAGFSNGDKVYVSSNYTYTLLIDMDTTQSSNDKLITRFTLDSYESVIDQQNKTITFTVPENQIVNGRIVGIITELEAGSDTIIFLVGGAEYPLRQGAQAGFSNGDKVYVSCDYAYTLLIV